MIAKLLVLCGILGALLAPLREAKAEFIVHVGPASAGNGGSNPLSIPPVDPTQYEFIYLTQAKREWVIGIIPGFFYGQRYQFNNYYVSVGVGLAIDGNNAGPGIYSAFGYNPCGTTFCFNAEFKQAVGIASPAPVSPYAVRIGMGFFP